LSYFAPKYFNCHLQPSRYEKFSPGEKSSDPWIERERERKWRGLKGLPPKEWEGTEKRGEGR